MLMQDGAVEGERLPRGLEETAVTPPLSAPGEPTLTGRTGPGMARTWTVGGGGEGSRPRVTVFGRTVTPSASSKVSHMSTNLFMLGKLDVFRLPAVGKHSHVSYQFWPRGLHPDPHGHLRALAGQRREGAATGGAADG